MQQPAGRVAETRRRTPRLVVLPNKARPIPLLHSTDAQMVGEDDVMDCEVSQNTTIPTIKVCGPENSVSVYDQWGESSTIRSLPPGRLNKRSTATKPAKALRPPQGYPANLAQAQRHAVTPEEAHKAIQVVIGYCQQQPGGFLEQQDGVSLGKLSERLRCSCE